MKAPRTIGHDTLVVMMKEAGVSVIDNRTPPPFNGAAMFALVDEKCKRLKITLTEAKGQMGVQSLSTLTRLAHGQAVDGNNIVRIMQWLDITDMSPFMR